MQVAIYSKILSIVKALSSGTSEILHGGHKQWVDVLALRSSKEVVLCSVQLSKLVVPDSEKPGTAHARPACSSPTPRVYSNSCPLSWWCQPTISSCVALFSSGLQFFPAYIPQYIPQYKTEVRKNSGFSQTVALFKISRVNTFTHVSSSVTVFQKFLQKLSQLILTATPPRATQIDGQKNRDSPVTSGGHPGRLGHLHPDPLSTLLYTKKA